jgi:redox-sensitive bicupin YhaK (pirin superfamily)
MLEGALDGGAGADGNHCRRHAPLRQWNTVGGNIAGMNDNAILIIDPREHDLGDGFKVRRALPHVLARHVGPFVFFDHMGPVRFEAGKGVDVRPHPHIGLATVTYLFEGAIEHRDTLGFVQTIRPGDVNWMTAGRGIAHSERTPGPERASGHRLHGIQVWVALPQDAEEAEPSFHHHGVGVLPLIERDGVALRLVVGRAFGRRSPVGTFSEMFYLAGEFSAGSRLVLPPEHDERAVYVIDAPITVGDREVAPGQIAVLPPGADVEIRAAAPAKAIVFGGTSLGERHLWWNFVSSSRERIEQAKSDWRAARFGQIPGETEFIPLPEK